MCVRVHFVTLTRLVGVTWTAAASGGMVAAMPQWLRYFFCSSWYTEILSRLDICHEMRPALLTIWPSSSPGLLKSGSYTNGDGFLSAYASALVLVDPQCLKV